MVLSQPHSVPASLSLKLTRPLSRCLVQRNHHQDWCRRFNWKIGNQFSRFMSSYTEIHVKIMLLQCEQDRRWNADKPSAALDPYIPTWLTTSPANHRPANFWIFFLNIGRKLWKVVQSQVELMKTNLKFEAPILWFFSTNNHLHYLSVYNGNVNIFSQYVTQDKLM